MAADAGLLERLWRRRRLCRVDRLDMEAFVQTPVTRLGPRPEWPRAIGTHTLNVGGGFEAVDWHGPG